jgi:hypothetical protein
MKTKGVSVDGKQFLGGTRFPIQQCQEGGNFDWSDPIPADGDGGSYQVAKLLELAIIAVKFQPVTQWTVFFPAGAVVLVLRGQLTVADQSTEFNGKRKFGYPMYLLEGFEMKQVKPATYANLVSCDQETVFLLFQPGGMEFTMLLQ